MGHGLSQEILEMIRYEKWLRLNRDEKLSLVNCAITDIYMSEEFKLDKKGRSIIGGLNRLRKSLIEANWVKPKYDD